MRDFAGSSILKHLHFGKYSYPEKWKVVVGRAPLPNPTSLRCAKPANLPRRAFFQILGLFLGVEMPKTLCSHFCILVIGTTADRLVDLATHKLNTSNNLEMFPLLHLNNRDHGRPAGGSRDALPPMGPREPSAKPFSHSGQFWPGNKPENSPIARNMTLRKYIN